MRNYIHSLTLRIKSKMRVFLNSLDLTSIGNIQNDRLLANITKEEVIDAINALKNNKSPDSDGYPASLFISLSTSRGSSNPVCDLEMNNIKVYLGM